MKKMTIALATVAALSAAGGFVSTVPNTLQTVEASAHETIKVSFVDEATNKVVSIIGLPSGDIHGFYVPADALPANYGFADDVNAPSQYANTGYTNSISIFVTPIVKHTISFVDSGTGKKVKQVELNSTRNNNDLETYELSGLLPQGYSIDKLIGENISYKETNSSGSTSVFVSRTGADNVRFENVQDGSIVGTGICSTDKDTASLPGYKDLINEYMPSSRKYNDLHSSSNGITTIKVRPDYSNKTVPAKFTSDDGKTIVGSGTITFDKSENIITSTPPSGYETFGPFADLPQFISGNFIIQAFDSSSDTSSSSEDTKNNASTNTTSTSFLQSQYNDLLAKYNTLNTSDVASLAKELASLKSQMATMQAEITALQHSSKSSSAKQLSVAGTVTVSGTKATVYNSKFAKTGRKLNVNSKWKVFSIVVSSNGHAYFNVGGGQYIPVGAAKLHATATKGKADTSIPVKTTATIKYKPGYSVQVWGKKFANFAKNTNGSNKKLKHGTSWKVFAVVKHNGHLYYDLGGAQYLDSAYATLK